jgi:GNAT superfamily N-acetyltransferase
VEDTTSVEVGARVATDRDIATLVQLYQEYSNCLADERGGRSYLLKEALPEPLDARFGSMLHDQGWLVLLGTLDQSPIGLAAARIETMPDSSRVATVEVVYVDPAAREVGVGELLLGSAVEWAARQGATGVDVRVLPGMRESKNFLEGSGFVARLLVMHQRLAD